MYEQYMYIYIHNCKLTLILENGINININRRHIVAPDIGTIKSVAVVQHIFYFRSFVPGYNKVLEYTIRTEYI